jgi:YggT family protein
MKLAGLGAGLIQIYMFLIWIRVILTWIRIPGTQLGNNGFTRWLVKIVDPFLNLFIGVGWLRKGVIDFTPVLGFALLSFVQAILSIFSRTGKLTWGICIALSMQILWQSIIAFIFWIIIIALALRLFFFYKSGPAPITLSRICNNLTEGIINWTQKVFFNSNIANDGHLLIVSLIFVVVLFIACRIGLYRLWAFLYTL